MNGKPLDGRMRLLALASVLLSVGLGACVRAPASGKKQIRYPYHASAERKEAIIKGLSHVKVGMSIEETVRVLGEADEITPLFEPDPIWGKQIGYSYWYLVQRLVESGSVEARAEKLLVLRTDLLKKVKTVDHWGIADVAPTAAVQPGVGPDGRSPAAPARRSTP